MSSRSATVLVIFIVACIAFCLATVFASMTGPISILPNESDTGSVLDNLSVITDSDNYNYQSYGYDDSKTDSSSSDDSQDDEPKVETTTDDTPTDNTGQNQNQNQNHDNQGDSPSSEANEEKNRVSDSTP